MNHNKTIKSVPVSEKPPDIEIAMDLLNKYYLIKDSILIRFQLKAKEKLSEAAKIVADTMMNPTAKRLMKVIINK